MKPYMGNLSYDINDQSLSELFLPYGTVTGTMDRVSRRPRSRPNEGRYLAVSEACSMEARTGGGGARRF
jgi:hypothetical protein